MKQIGQQHNVDLKSGFLLWAMSAPGFRMFCSIPRNLFVFSIWTKVLATAVIQSLSQGASWEANTDYSPEQKKQEFI